MMKQKKKGNRGKGVDGTGGMEEKMNEKDKIRKKERGEKN